MTVRFKVFMMLLTNKSIDHRHTQPGLNLTLKKFFLQHSYVFVKENFPLCPKSAGGFGIQEVGSGFRRWVRDSGGGFGFERTSS